MADIATLVPPSRRSFRQAYHYRKGRRAFNRHGITRPANTICGVTLHSMEGPEKGDTAESTQAYFARSDIRVSSAHKNFDSDSIASSVHDEDEAFHAPPLSRVHIGYEQAGYARQSREDWLDPFSYAMLRNVAAELAADSKKYGFPLVFLTAADLRAGRLEGVTTHYEDAQAFGETDHWDPGKGYPIDLVMEMAIKGVHAVAPPKANGVIKPGDVGKQVAFLQGMLNILWRYRINAKGRSGGGQLRIEADPTKAGYGPKTTEAVREFERFLNVMRGLSGQKKRPVTGIADAEFAKGVAYWVPIAFKRG